MSLSVCASPNAAARTDNGPATPAAAPGVMGEVDDYLPPSQQGCFCFLSDACLCVASFPAYKVVVIGKRSFCLFSCVSRVLEVLGREYVQTCVCVAKRQTHTGDVSANLTVVLGSVMALTIKLCGIQTLCLYPL